jgi:hypothetical protein
VKEDRLLMKWEDDSARLHAEILSLREANHHAQIRITQQQEEYSALVRTVANFGTKSSPPRSQSVSAVPSKKAAPTTLQQHEDGFMSIDRNKAKKGPIHSFFQQSHATSPRSTQSKRIETKKMHALNARLQGVPADMSWPPSAEHETGMTSQSALSSTPLCKIVLTALLPSFRCRFRDTASGALGQSCSTSNSEHRARASSFAHNSTNFCHQPTNK